jgi:hypothetical protein
MDCCSLLPIRAGYGIRPGSRRLCCIGTQCADTTQRRIDRTIALFRAGEQGDGARFSA